jgi:hypothetical protein
MKRIALVLALAGSAILGSVVSTTASTPTTEQYLRDKVANCAVRDEAVKLGLAWADLPHTFHDCLAFEKVRRFGR